MKPGKTKVMIPPAFTEITIVYLTMPFPVQFRTRLVTSENSSCVFLAKNKYETVLGEFETGKLINELNFN